jgi:hypothetical protein
MTKELQAAAHFYRCTGDDSLLRKTKAGRSLLAYDKWAFRPKAWERNMAKQMGENMGKILLDVCIRCQDCFHEGCVHRSSTARFTTGVSP